MAYFFKLQDFNCYVKSLNNDGRPNEYCLFLNQKDIEGSGLLDFSDWTLQYDVNKVVILYRCNNCGREGDSLFIPKNVECLGITDCKRNPHKQYSNIQHT
ncbi:hypothetical protein Ddye_008752 [Dipteronia dyeriana]|uniref:Uncharacterized protein n=1 Tax=Dipteronia dyeriana TaxID=168575 RepID=A0AAD9XAD3_9ROSI|nr:hypothetical protein Ddye_008752 [Dipteronia dyeriana]